MSTVLKTKIAQVRVTAIDPGQSSCLQLGEDLVRAARLHMFERVLVLGPENGARFETYVEPVATHGTVRFLGADAREVEPDDRIDILAFTDIAAGIPAEIVQVDGKNSPIP